MLKSFHSFSYAHTHTWNYKMENNGHMVYNWHIFLLNALSINNFGKKIL